MSAGRLDPLEVGAGRKPSGSCTGGHDEPVEGDGLTVGPSKPSLRSVSAALNPAREAPTMTYLEVRATGRLWRYSDDRGRRAAHVHEDFAVLRLHGIGPHADCAGKQSASPVLRSNSRKCNAHSTCVPSMYPSARE